MAYKFQVGAAVLTGSITGSTTVTAVNFHGGGSNLTGIVANPMGEALSLGDNNITNVGSIAADSVVVDDAAVGLEVTFGGNNTLNKITLTDNLADALNINEGGNSYMKFITTNSSEQIVFGKNSTFNGTTIADLGTVTTATSITATDLIGTNVDGIIGADTARAGTFAAIVGSSLSVGDGNITNVGDINCDSISVDAAGTGLNIDYSGGNTGTNLITLADNLADALSIKEGSNVLMKFTTTDDQALLTLGYDSMGVESAGQHFFEAGMALTSLTTGSSSDNGDAAVSSGNHVILCSGSTSALTLRLPTISELGGGSGEKGYPLYIKRAYGQGGGGAQTDRPEMPYSIEVSCSGVDTIDGATSIVLNTAGASVMLFGTGSIWHVF